MSVFFKSPRELVLAAKYSLQGLRSVWKTEKAFRTDVAVFLLSVAVAAILPVGTATKALLVFSTFQVPLAEIVNTAIETLIDRISTERHPLSGRAKDIGSAIVFTASVGAVLVWSIVLVGIIF